MLDKRVSVWDVPMHTVDVAGVTYVLNKAPERGASCIVYDAIKQELVDGEVSPQRVLLKEFYPLLSEENAVGIIRQEDETLMVSQRVLDSDEYKQAFEQFKKGYFTIRKLANKDEGAEFLSVPSEMIAANGTWYIVEPYDSGIPFSELFMQKKQTESGEKRKYDFQAFLGIYHRCLETVAKLHRRGFYHLDLKPSNVSYTAGGNVKLFDTDTFLEKTELKQVKVFLTTKGYSAPELELAASSPADVPYWIGPWTDAYSLAQFICWYLFGKPLEEEELEEYLPHLEEKITESFGGYSPLLAPKGLVRLKYFLMRNLNSDRYLRHQSIEDEMLPEIEKIQEYLFYYEPGEPIDNFKQSKKPLRGYGEEIEQLEEVLFGPSQRYGYGAKLRKTGVVAVGMQQQTREDVARYYATLHRLDYSGIVEVHCNTFEGLIEKLKPEKGVPLQNPHEDPILFLLFDRQEEDVFSIKEVDEIKQLLELRNCHVLVTGRHNRLLNVYPELEKDISLPTVDIGKRQDEQFIKDMLDIIEKDPDFPKWTWKQTAWKALLALALFVGGYLLSSWMTHVAETLMYFNSVSGEYVCNSWLGVTAVMAGHIWANGISMLGLAVGIYCIYDLVTPRGWRYFLRQYREYIMVGWMTLTSLNIPYIFRAFSFQELCDIFGFRHWQTIETCLHALQLPILLTFMFMIALWIFHVIDGKFKNSVLFVVIAVLLSCLVFAHIVVQTVANPWELLLHGVFIWLAEAFTQKYYDNSY